MISQEFKFVFEWAEEQVTKAETLEQLTVIWKRFQCLQKLPGWKKIMSTKKNQLLKK